MSVIHSRPPIGFGLPSFCADASACMVKLGKRNRGKFMDFRQGFVAGLLVVTSSSVIAADMLPLKQGIYVPVATACKGAPNSAIVNYWGGKSSIGAAQAECTIRKLSKKGSVYTLVDECKDIQSGDVIEGGPTVVTIKSPTGFAMSGVSYKYCGTKVQF